MEGGARRGTEEKEIEYLRARSVKKAKSIGEFDAHSDVMMKPLFQDGGAVKDLEKEKDISDGDGLSVGCGNSGDVGGKSYKDSVVGTQAGSDSQPMESGSSERSDSDSESEEEAFDEEIDEEEDPFCPRIEVSKEERKEWCKVWKRSLIVKVLGREVSLDFLRNRLLKLWNLKAQLTVLDLGNDICKKKEDANKEEDRSISKEVEKARQIVEDSNFGSWMVAPNADVIAIEGDKFYSGDQVAVVFNSKNSLEMVPIKKSGRSNFGGEGRKSLGGEGSYILYTQKSGNGKEVRAGRKESKEGVVSREVREKGKDGKSMKEGTLLRSMIPRIRGTGGKSFPLLLNDFISEYGVSIVAMFETRRGGDKAVEVLVEDFQFIHAIVKPRSGGVFLLTTMYCSPDASCREVAFEKTKEFGRGINCPWVVGGDFNAYLTCDEKVGGSGWNRRSMLKFGECVNDCGWIDLGYNGVKFTLERQGLKERIDQFFSNSE
ncbi:reverse transcriptase [Senna tora]|uniref:Reverse transcriptase n=1 Tax=Senna tora TaxID=362788 RepID=A0A834TST2_9FABA|nr:reverse transcriptase [Senna tora]